MTGKISEKIKGPETGEAKIAIVESEEKLTSNPIASSVNMNVTLRDDTGSKFLQRAQSLMILTMAIVFAVAGFYLKSEIRALDEQMNLVNTNLMMLMIKYDKFNEYINRFSYDKLSSQNIPKREPESSEVVLLVGPPINLNSDLPLPNYMDVARQLDESLRSHINGNILEEASALDDLVKFGEPRNTNEEMAMT